MSPAGPNTATAVAPPLSVPLDEFLIELADALNTTLDLDALLNRVAELVRKVIPYEIFAILLLNEKTQELRMRFNIGHTPDVQRIRIKVGQGITGQAVLRREPFLCNDVAKEPSYINGHPLVKSELAIPLVAKNSVIGVIDIQSSVECYFTEEHSRVLTLVASRIAVAMENARLYTRVYKQAKTLEVLNEISRELTSILNLDQLLARMGEILSRVIDYQMFSVLLLDESGQTLQHRFSLRFKENINLKHDIPVGRGLVGAAVETRETILVPDVSKDPRYIMLNPETRSELAIPLIYKDKVIGVLDLEHTRRGYFNDDNMRTVTTLAAQIAVAIENARLYERIHREERRMERDLAMAREVQNHLLPNACPALPNAELCAKFIPARTIGGDIYDYIPYSGGRLAIAVSDVSGKGAPAALFGALVSGIMRSTAALEPPPSEMQAAVNAALNERKIEAHYVSMLYAVWDDERLSMHIANSGQPRPMFVRDGNVSMIETAGIPLGLLEDTDYEDVTVSAQPGDLFVFFSDGIVDAQNRKEEMFGRTRLEEVIRKNSQKSPDAIVDAVYATVNKHRGSAAPFDDETIVVLKVKGAPPGPDAQIDARRRPRKTSPALRNV